MDVKTLALSDIAGDVRSGMLAIPRTLPSHLFYDSVGSSLFEEITRLPEYYLTSAERSIFELCADEIIEAAGRDLSVVELGAGTAAKSVLLLRALVHKQGTATYCPVDVSPSALIEARERVSAELPSVSLHPIVTDYTRGLPFLSSLKGRKLVLYIGSSIGNFEPMHASALLSHLRRSMSPGDVLLLGTDMRKSPEVLLPAYDDSQGVTAAFNKNILSRINRELGADFDLESFAHRVVWNTVDSRIEMHLESLADQTVCIAAIPMTVRFRRGERIHTENSYKYSMKMIDEMAANASLTRERTWTDAKNLFTVHLLRR